MTRIHLCTSAPIMLLLALICSASPTTKVMVDGRVPPATSSNFMVEPQPTALLGLWETTKNSMGGIGNTLEFRSDGTFVDAITVIVNGHYRVVGNRRIFAEHLPAGDADASNSPQIKVDDHELVETNPDKSVIRKQRLGTPQVGKPLIVGYWRYRHYTGAIAFERYMVDGTMFFRLPLKSNLGRYSLNNNELTLTRAGQADVKVKVELRGDQMLLSESADHIIEYHRDSAGPWYDREHIDYQPPAHAEARPAEMAIRPIPGLQLRVIEFSDRPDPNTGTSHVLETAQPWPLELNSLVGAVGRTVEARVAVSDIWREELAVGATRDLEATTVRVVDATNGTVQVLVRMHAAPQPVEVTVPVNGTVVIGSEAGEQRHAYVAVSLFDRAMSERIPEVFSMHEEGITQPIKVSGAEVQAPPDARVNHRTGIIVQTEVDEQGNVVTVQALVGMFIAASDIAEIEKTVRTWKFKPATLDGKPVRVVTDIHVIFRR